MYHNYNQQIEDNQASQRIVRKDMESLGAKFLMWNDSNDKFDLAMEMSGKVMTFAIKSDPTDIKKDFFIEYRLEGKKTFLDATEAIVMCFVFPTLDEIWYVQTMQLENKIHTSDTIQSAYNKERDATGWVMTRNYMSEIALVRKITDKQTKAI